MSYKGDFPDGGSVYIEFDSFDENGGSISITGLALADIKVYKDGSVTQRTSTAGFALLDTDGMNFDGIVGINGISIDLSDNTDAGFFAAGSDYWVVVDSVGLGLETISFTAATFSIENRFSTSAAAILTTQMTEAYNTDGTAPTMAEALFVIMQRLVDFTIIGTAISVKGIDGTTEKYTLVLDDGTTPTTSSRDS
jgi:hypothetical protein